MHHLRLSLPISYYPEKLLEVLPNISCDDLNPYIPFPAAVFAYNFIFFSKGELLYSFQYPSHNLISPETLPLLSHKESLPPSSSHSLYLKCNGTKLFLYQCSSLTKMWVLGRNEALINLFTSKLAVSYTTDMQKGCIRMDYKLSHGWILIFLGIICIFLTFICERILF